MMNTSLEGTESANTSDFTVANDFRKITLIRTHNQVVQCAATTLRGTKAVELTVFQDHICR